MRRISVAGADSAAIVPNTAGDRQDLATYLGRILRLAPTSAVRLQEHPSDPTRLLAWGVVLGVLVRREFGASLAGRPDLTVMAEELNRAVSQSVSRSGSVALPGARDDRWRATLPPASGWEHREDLPVAQVLDAVDTSAASLKDADAMAINAAGEAMLGLPVITIYDDSGGGAPLELPLRLVLAATRMGYLGRDDSGGEDVVRVASNGPWTVIATRNGAVFKRTTPIDLLTIL